MTTELTKRILLVEDSPLMMKAMRFSLEREGYKCMVAATASEAIELLKREIPNIILSDYEMPEMNGFEFRDILRKNPMWKDIPFVFLTAHSDEYLVLQGLNLDAIDYIVKGTPIPVIISKLTNILGSLRVEHERSITELRNAAEALNVRSVPSTVPAIDGYNICFWHQPFQNYPGGDFIDFIKIDDRYSFVVLGDIMGKKWKAWFFSFGYLSYIRSAIRFCVLDRDFTLDHLVQKINKIICLDESMENILSTLSLLLLDSHTGQVHYTGAGDLPLLFYKAQSKTITTIASSGLLLGLQEEGVYNKQVIAMEPGDQLMLFTDGLIDIRLDNDKKSDYPFFAGSVQPYFGTENTFGTIKADILHKITIENQLDDASLIFIEKT